MSDLYNKIRKGIIYDTKWLINQSKKAKYGRLYTSHSNKYDQIKLFLIRRNSILRKLKDIPQTHIKKLNSYIYTEKEYKIKHELPEDSTEYTVVYTMYYIYVIGAIIDIEKFHEYNLNEKNYKPKEKAYNNALELINTTMNPKIKSAFPKQRADVYISLERNLKDIDIEKKLFSGKEINYVYDFIKYHYDNADNEWGNNKPTRLSHHKAWDFLK